MARTKGVITKWKDEKKFGFIAPVKGAEIYFHINSFIWQSRLPEVGDVVTFEIVCNHEGKSKAIKLLFPGEKNPGKIDLMTDVFFVFFSISFLISTFILFHFSYLPLLIFGIYIFFSLITFIRYFIDKSAAKSNEWRTSEKSLHTLSLIGGWPGALIAQRIFHHKSRKRSFQIIFWVTVIANIFLTSLTIFPISKKIGDSFPQSYAIEYNNILNNFKNKFTKSNVLNENKNKSAIYSWTNKDGRKIYSNVGFPKDQPYKDGKVEWH